MTMDTDPKDILNWRRVDARLTLSGQPTAAQLQDICAMGVAHVINLAPSDNDGALPDEAERVTGLGMRYTYIPVDFDGPTQEDYNRFCEALEGSDAQFIHIHCIYNARVSAFMLRYAMEGRGGSEQDARKLMDGIWRPGGVWAEFLGDADNLDQPNRYAGYDY